MDRRAHTLWIVMLAVGAGCGGGADDSVGDAAGSDAGVQTGVSATGGALGTGGAKASGTGGAQAVGGAAGTGGATGSGGAQAAGGAKGTGGSSDSGAPNVLACDKVGDAGDAVDDVTPPWHDLKAPVAGCNLSFGGVAVDPKNPGIVYAGSTAYPCWSPNAFWKSTDCGATWTQPATGKNASGLLQGDPGAITVDPITSDVYSMSFYGSGKLYKSHNGGVDWDDVTPTGTGVPGFVQGWAMDPTDHNHVVVTFHADCSAPGLPSSIHSCLAETKDGAATWQVFPGLTKNWAEGFGVVVLGGARWLANSWPTLYYTSVAGRYTSDPSEAWQPLTMGYPGCTTNQGNFVDLSGTYYLGCGTGVATSTDAQSWTTLAGTPVASGLIATDDYLYADRSEGNGHPLWRASRSDLHSFAQVQSLLATPVAGQGNDGPMAYDSSHHLLYVATQNGGLWRVATR
jgi:hypothetical protein